jgi:subtilisin family serine protease
MQKRLFPILSLLLLSVLLTINIPFGSGEPLGALAVQMQLASLDSTAESFNGTGRDELPDFATWRTRRQVNFVDGRVIVKLKPGVEPTIDSRGVLQTGQATLDATLTALGVETITPVFPLLTSSERSVHEPFSADASELARVYRLQLAPGSSLFEVIERLSADPYVVYAEPDYLAHAAFVPNDHRYSDQWGLAKIEAEAAWDVTQGSAAVTIAIVDTGIDLDHPDLADKLWINPGEIPGNGVDDDGNGYIDDIHGWNWVDNNNNPQDDIGHGTHVAGIAAAATDNAIGIAGTCPDCRLMALKVLDAAGQGSYSNIAAAIAYAADKGAHVVNLSLGGYGNSQLLREAVAAASEIAVVVAAAGNGNRQDRFYPAAYEENVIAVTATDPTDQKAAFANYGDWIDLTAPGVSIWSTMYNDTYAVWSGSSMAVPFVSGVAGLVYSHNPDWSAGAVRGHLLQTVDDIDAANPGYAGLLGVGRLNAYQSVTVAAVPELSIVDYAINGVPSGSPEPGSIVTMTVSLRNVWADASGVTGVLSTTDPYVTVINDTTNYGDIAGYSTVTNTAEAFGFSLSAAAPYNHAIPFELALSGDDGVYTETKLFTAAVSSGLEYVSGVISQDTTWTPEITYVVSGNTLVSEGVTLTILPGTIVRFANGRSLQINGILIADGTESYPILMTSTNANPAPGNWNLLRFSTTAGSAQVDENNNYLEGSLLRYTQIEYGMGVSLQGVTAFFDNVIFANNVGNTDGQTIGGANGPGALFVELYRYGTSDDVLVVQNSQFISNTSGGLIVHGYARRAIIHDNIFAYNGGQAVHVEMSTELTSVKANLFNDNNSCIAVGIATSSTIIEDNSFVKCRNPAISTGVGIDIMGGDPLIRRNLFSNSGTSIESSSYSVISGGNPIATSNTIAGSQVGSIFLVYSAVSRYGWNNLVRNWSTYDFYRHPSVQADVDASLNYWGTTDESEISARIFDYYDDFEPGKIVFMPILESPYLDAPGFLLNAALNEDILVGLGTFVLWLDFSKAMSTETLPDVSFGISPAYNTHIIPGNWVSPTHWAGSYNVTHYTGDGIQRVRVAGAIGSDDGIQIPEDTSFIFEIATIGATTVNAEPGYGYVDLSWAASELEIVAGYNIYRASESGGPYSRLNPSIVTETSYLDTSVTNGVTYYYVAKLLTTDLYEMDYSSEAAATPNDYTPPTTPIVVDEGSCTPYSDRLYASWSANDPESGISEYQYGIGSWAGGMDVINWTSAGINTEVTRTGLTLLQGVTYYINVRARNDTALWSAVGSSNGIQVKSGCPAVAFSADITSGYVPLTVQFTDETVGSALEHLWHFGDGSSSSEADPVHTYTSTGSFTVTLTVTGSVASNTRLLPNYITVSEPPPIQESFAVYLPLVAMQFGNSMAGQNPTPLQFTPGTTWWVHTVAQAGAISSSLLDVQVNETGGLLVSSRTKWRQKAKLNCSTTAEKRAPMAARFSRVRPVISSGPCRR